MDELNPLLFGKDPTPGLVGLHPAGNQMRLYFREGSYVISEDRDFMPFFFLSDPGFLSSFDGAHFFRLHGPGFYRHLVWFESIAVCREAIKRIQLAAEEEDPACLYKPGGWVQQYLIQSGMTLFKGMKYDDLLRMAIDIEVYSEPNTFPNADRPGDEVIIISVGTNRGDTWLLETGNGKCESQILRELVDLIRDEDPDVIEGHNIYKFDLPYLATRAKLCEVPFTIGRDGSEPFFYPSSFRAAERTLDFEACQIRGRHIVDTYFATLTFDAVKRAMPGHGLKEAAQYFGFAREGREYIPGDQISEVWKTDPDRVLRYALDDVLETLKLAEHLTGSSFYITQMVPNTYEKIVRTGAGGKIESLFVREYLRRREALPQAEEGRMEVGGYTDVFVQGLVGPVVYADVASLYPSIMLNRNVQPARDTLKIFPELLRALTELRFQWKAEVKKARGSNRQRLDTMQNSAKILINSFFGTLGFSRFLFNDFDEADRVTTTGQEILRQMVNEIRKDGGTVVEIDTDGVIFIPPDDIRGEKAEETYVRSLTERMSKGVVIDFDGRAEKMISYRKKNYVLKDYDGKVTMKGSSLISRSMEPFGKRFLRKAFELILNEEWVLLRNTTLSVRDSIMNGRLTVEDLSVTVSLNKSLEEYRNGRINNTTPIAAAYELALHLKYKGVPMRKGDRVTYYIARGPKNLSNALKARLASDYADDEDTRHYLNRFETIVDRLRPLFSPEDFACLFDSDQGDLFQDISRIRVLTSENIR